ncbi:MAG TPA: hypothetical protein VGR88_02800 [Ktedonobacterales bacterium]|nr:hypothetical protein [Ktedonobacterales bacterium]
MALTNTTLGALMATIDASIVLIALPSTFFTGLTRNGVPAHAATTISHLPPTAALFGAFLGYNPIQQLLPPAVLHAISPANQATLLGKTFFPGLISTPFMSGMRAVFYVSAVLCLVAAAASLLRGRQVIYGRDATSSETVGSGAAAPAELARGSVLKQTEQAPTMTIWTDDDSPTGALTRERS